MNRKDLNRVFETIDEIIADGAESLDQAERDIQVLVIARAIIELEKNKSEDS